MVSRIAPGLKHMDADLSPERQKKGINADQQPGLLISGQTNGVFSLRAFSAPTDDPSAEALGK